MTFTIVSHRYAEAEAEARPVTHRVPAHGHATHTVDPLAAADGWYDLSVTVSGDTSWSRRYVGHLEDGSDSVTG